MRLILTLQSGMQDAKMDQCRGAKKTWLRYPYFRLIRQNSCMRYSEKNYTDIIRRYNRSNDEQQGKLHSTGKTQETA